MAFTYQDQLQYAKLALSVFELEKNNPESLKKLIDVGELVKKYAAEDDNALIYDVTDYIYEQLRLLNGEDGAYDDVELYQRLTSMVRDL